jgi:mono/diheme cytochrome c family protein
VRRAPLSLLVLAMVLLVGCSPPGRKEKIVSPLPKKVVGTLPTKTTSLKGDPTKGKALYTAQGCGGCHTFKPAGSNAKIGPDLDNLAADAKKANQGPLAVYAVESIKNPGAYVVPGFPNGVMPNYGSQLSDQQIADLAAFLTKGT